MENILDKAKLEGIISKIEQQDKIFANKSALDIKSFSGKIIGRDKQAEALVKSLLGYKQGYVVPLVSVYGRSGSGKSTLVKFVVSNLDGISYSFVNLRKAKTIFGAANLILSELGMPNIKAAQGINLVIDEIGKSIQSVLSQQSKKLFVLVLDEFDVIFDDKRAKPSDFVYKLLVLEETLRQRGYYLSIVCISNNVLSDYDMDDRVKSRIGNSEIFFEPYSTSYVLAILKDRAREAFAIPVNVKVLEECAKLASLEHGDARRAIDLLRISAEIASSKGEELSVSHVTLASNELQKDRIENVVSNASYHQKVALLAIARMSFLTGQEWHHTSVIYKIYCKLVQSDIKSMGYRRVSDLLTDLANSGLLTSQTFSKGRGGYGKQYKLVVSPETIGRMISLELWSGIENAKAQHDQVAELGNLDVPSFGKKSAFDSLGKSLERVTKKNWDEYVKMS
ncbi:MAG TPA: AAA family ATPase [Verrucomicrobiae bacterium]|nr:AAA family ATPase [Verrucomicrobiae bacterium]